MRGQARSGCGPEARQRGDTGCCRCWQVSGALRAGPARRGRGHGPVPVTSEPLLAALAWFSRPAAAAEQSGEDATVEAEAEIIQLLKQAKVRVSTGRAHPLLGFPEAWMDWPWVEGWDPSRLVQGEFCSQNRCSCETAPSHFPYLFCPNVLIEGVLRGWLSSTNRQAERDILCIEYV